MQLPIICQDYVSQGQSNLLKLIDLIVLMKLYFTAIHRLVYCLLCFKR